MVESLAPRPWTILPADAKAASKVNPLVHRAGIRSAAEFMDVLREGLASVPEVKKLAEVTARHGAVGVLSGGSASMLVGEILRAKAECRSMKPLNDLGSDVDALVMGQDERMLSAGQVRTLLDELNAENRHLLSGAVPSGTRRRLVLEWDLQDSRCFYDALETFGGDSLSQFGIGLSSSGKLFLFDPYEGLEDFFRGELRYRAPADPWNSSYAKQLHYDPSLEGLRLIRMVGRFKEYGVEPTLETVEQLQAMGQAAFERRNISKALMAATDDSGDHKLARRWAKYVDRIWADASQISEALSLLERSRYADVLRHLGLGPSILERLPGAVSDLRTAEANFHAICADLPRSPIVAGASVPAPSIWLSSKMLDQFLRGEVFGKSGGPFGAGLSCLGSPLEGKGYGAALTSVALRASAAFLDLRTDEGREFVARAADRLGVTGEAIGVRIDRIAAAYGIAGVLTGGEPPDVTIKSTSGIAKLERTVLSAREILDGISRLDPRTTKPIDVAWRIRAAIVLEGERAVDRLAELLSRGELGLEQLLSSDVVAVLIEAPVRSRALQRALADYHASVGAALPAERQIELYRLMAGLAVSLVDKNGTFALANT